MTDPTEDPKDSIHTCLATHPRDWSLNSRDAWMYGIICGWDRSTVEDLAKAYHWSGRDVDRLARLRKAWEKLA